MYRGKGKEERCACAGKGRQGRQRGRHGAHKRHRKAHKAQRACVWGRERRGREPKVWYNRQVVVVYRVGIRHRKVAGR